MRMMELIRKKGGTCLGIFLAVFLVSVFAGLGVGAFSFKSCDMQGPVQQTNSSARKLVTDQPGLEQAMLVVNGQPVLEKDFLDKFTRWTANQQSNDPGQDLQGYAAAAYYSISEAVIAAKGKDLGVKVEKKDIDETRAEIISSLISPDGQSSSGNIIGDFSKGLTKSRDEKAAFTSYLSRQNLTEEKWTAQVRIELMQSKTQEAWQKVIDDEKTIAAGETKAIIDQRLADGDSFESLILEFSEDPNIERSRETGAVEPMWLSRGLVTKDQEIAMFGTEAGKLTDWVEVPAGWSRFEVLEHKKAQGPEFEAERESIITSLKEGNEEFEPTDEQIARQYEQVNVIQIMLKTSDPGAVNKLIGELVKQADVQMNSPYVLAYQALSEDKLQPPAGWDLAKLKTIAELAAVGEDYDFSLIQEHLDRAEELKAGEDEKPVDETEAATPEDGEATDEAVDEEPVPLYALAIGLFKLALQGDKEPPGYFPYYIIGRTYLDWLADEDNLDIQPINRDLAREEIETNLSRAMDRLDYSSSLHAGRGLNQAWLGMHDEAIENLDKALKYSPNQFDDPVFEDIRKGYEVLDAQDKLTALDEKIAEMRQAQLQQMIQQMQSQQGDQGNVVNIPAGSDLDEVLGTTEVGGDDGEWIKIEDEEAAPDTEGSGAEDGGSGEAPAADDSGDAAEPPADEAENG